MASENVLQVIDLCKSFHKLEVLKNISVTFKKNEVVSIIGPSGGGKSTFLRCLNLLEKPTSGKVFIGRHEISKMTENELAEFRQQHLGFIFQSYNLLPTMTAAENVALPLMFKGVTKRPVWPAPAKS